uniref:Ig-like domain-containing protein n=1 Tax=Amphiprion ocellaris TaxID=80972 RepID=A0AAQ5XTS3_AMPOC
MELENRRRAGWLSKNSMMSHIKDQLLLKSELSVWIFLLLIHCSEGQHQLIGPTQPIVAMFGDDIVLPCRLEPAVDAAARTVEWSRPDLKQRIIHFRRDSVDLLTEQNPSYTRRTSLSISKLKSGDVSLKLSKVKLSDAGTYKCIVSKYGTESAVELVVGSVSSPEIEVSKDSSSVVLQCESAGWYPEPEVLWLDAEGNLLSAGPTETVRGPDDLYSVSSRVTVEKKHGNKFTCRVQQNNINQTRDTWIHVSADLFMVHSNLSARITTTMAACVMTIAVVVFIVWKWGQTRTKRQKEETELRKREMWMIGNDVELELLMEGQRDREQSMLGREKMKYLEMKKAKFDEQLQKNEEELKHVQQVIEVFKKQKEDLKTQKEKLLSLQEKEKMKIKEIDMMKDPLLDKKNKQQKREKAKQEAAQKNTEHEELLKNTEKLLETTEEMIVKMTERKGKLKTNKEQIVKHLKSTEQQIELQKKLEESERKEDKDNPPLNKQTTEQLQGRPQVELDQPEEEHNNPC